MGERTPQALVGYNGVVVWPGPTCMGALGVLLPASVSDEQVAGYLQLLDSLDDVHARASRYANTVRLECTWQVAMPNRAACRHCGNVKDEYVEPDVVREIKLRLRFAAQDAA